MPAYAKIRNDLIVSQSVVEGQTVYTIKEPTAGGYFQLREPEYWLISQLDGERSYEEIAQAFCAKWGMALEAKAVEGFVGALGRSHFLESGGESAASHAETSTFDYAQGDDTPSAESSPFDSAQGDEEVAQGDGGEEDRGGDKPRPYGGGDRRGGRSLASRLLFIKLKGIDPRPVLRLVAPLYRWLHHPAGIMLALAVMVAGMGVFVANWEHFAISPSEIFRISSILLIVATTFVTLVIHEFGHAAVCRHYGGEVREMGFLLLYFQPCFYADVSDAWLFPKKTQRLAVTWAGPFVQFLVFAIAVIVWRVTVPGSFPSEIALIVILVSGISVLFNFNPLIKLDGYYLLSDWVEIPNLRARAFAWLGNWCQRVLLGWPVAEVMSTKRQSRVFFWYAALALIYSGILIGWLLVIVGKFLLAEFGGWGLLGLALVLVFLMKANIAATGRGVVRHLGYMGTSLKNPFRALAYGAAAFSLVIGLFFVPFPHRVSGDVTVAPIREFTLRLNEFGLLERTMVRRGADPETKTGYMQMVSQDMASLDLTPLVSDGQQVMAGDTVALLMSNQVTTQLAAAVSELDRLERELVLLQSPPKPEAIAEAAAQVKAAQTALDQRERDYERVKGLRERNLISDQQYEASSSALDLAKAELANKQAGLELLKAPPKKEQEAVLQAEIDKQRAQVRFLQTQEEAQSVTSPIDGTVRISPGDGTILSVLDSREIEVLIPVTDFDIELVREDLPVFLKVRSFPDVMFEGKVKHVPSAGTREQEKAQFPVSAVVPNERYQLASGMTGYAKIDIGRLSLAELGARKVGSFVRVEFWSWW